MIRMREVPSIIAMLLALLLLLTLVAGLVYYILGIPTSSFLKVLSYFVQSYVLPVLALILLFVIKLDKRN